MKVRYLKSDELRHHGVDGQKWGVKNGPPYPLDSSVSTGKQLKKAQKKVSKDIANIVTSSKNRHTTTDDVSEYLNRNVRKEELNKLQQKANKVKDLEKKVMPNKNELHQLYKKAQTEAISKVGNKKNFDDEDFYELSVIDKAEDLFFDSIQKSISSKKEGKQYKEAISDYQKDLINLTDKLVGDYSKKILRNAGDYTNGRKEVNKALTKMGGTKLKYNDYTGNLMTDIEKIQMDHELEELR